MLFREAVIIDLRRGHKKKKVHTLSKVQIYLILTRVNTYLPLGMTRKNFLSITQFWMNYWTSGKPV